jgi:iron complex outermembrane receptor protein
MTRPHPRPLPARLSLLACALATLAAQAQAQTSAQDPAPEKAPQTLQRVEIVGSSIKRISAEGPSPIAVYKRADIEATGATSTVELLSKMAAVTAFDDGSNSNSFSAGATSASLRNMGAQNVLVLLNGRRLANFAFGSIGGSSSVDLNSIPFAAIDRIEVLRDGASATYGTDAVGGVINFITRKDYDKGNLTLKYGDTEKHIGGTESSASIAFGMGGSRPTATTCSSPATSRSRPSSAPSTRSGICAASTRSPAPISRPRAAPSRAASSTSTSRPAPTPTQAPTSAPAIPTTTPSRRCRRRRPTARRSSAAASSTRRCRRTCPTPRRPTPSAG